MIYPESRRKEGETLRAYYVVTSRTELTIVTLNPRLAGAECFRGK